MSKCTNPERIQYFNDIKFVEALDTHYFTNQEIHMSMHRYVWEFYNGPIPEGYVIHHIDRNRANNDISNLQCLTATEHSQLHGRQLTDEEREWRRNNFKTKARPKAIEWHKSDAGKEWHKEQARYRKDNRKIVKGTCLQCGKEVISYNNKGHASKFCSGACAQKYRRDNGLDKIDRVCPVCGKSFKGTKTQLTCGRSCAITMRWQEGGIFENRKRKGN